MRLKKWQKRKKSFQRGNEFDFARRKRGDGSANDTAAAAI